MSAPRFPDGYETRMLTLDELRAKHAPRMHPEFERRLFAWIEHKAGAVGIGGGFRTTQPDRPGFAPDGRSFHQLQRFASGISAYCAVDLVAPDGPDGGHAHDGVTWAVSADAPEFGLHTFVTGEPWHIQPIEIRGWQTWVAAGRPDPLPPTEEEPMRVVKLKGQPGAFVQSTVKTWLSTPAERDAAIARLGPMVELDLAEFVAAGPVVGETPKGYDADGVRR
jgi:hypothetical protein